MIVGIIGLYFKMKSDGPPAEEGEMFQELSRNLRDMSSGAFDVLSFGTYVCLTAAVYLALVSFGKIKDKEFYKPTAVKEKTNS